MKQLDRAIEAYQTVLVFNPTHLDALMNLAAIAELHGQQIQSLDYYKRVLLHHPDQALALKKIAKELIGQGFNDDETLTYLERICRVNPNDTECLLLLGSLYEKRYHFQDAIDLFEQARRINPKLERLAQGKIRHWKNLLSAGAGQHLEGSASSLTK
jgi:tetratricopeptide (TPR) repeat protein